MSDAIRMYRDMGFSVMEHPYSNAPTPGAIYLMGICRDQLCVELQLFGRKIFLF